ncbi:hypothetical protein [uncultured Algimonas sp.]|uniref:hypothetical protein n=1 Tax=uncultured Algimonas sp. TaxID=1547920 RepID=UPI0026265C25|nr:hypothetical protein [uncultured Algimonas sp.]
MRFVPYLALIVSFGLGYLSYPFFLVFIVAILSAVLLFPLRRDQLRTQPQAPDRNMILDGAFLVFQQTLIHFVAFALGIFLMRMMGG